MANLLSFHDFFSQAVFSPDLSRPDVPAVYVVNECLDFFGIFDVNEGISSSIPIWIAWQHNFIDLYKLLAHIFDFFLMGVIWDVHEVNPPSEQ